jgi:hypothetical protein
MMLFKIAVRGLERYDAYCARQEIFPARPVILLELFLQGALG